MTLSSECHFNCDFKAFPVTKNTKEKAKCTEDQLQNPKDLNKIS